MRKHNGMRPQDIAILLKIISKGKLPWQNKDLARELYLSPSEISESLSRSQFAGLINFQKKEPHRQSLLEFIRYGLHYVFPVSPAGLTNGIVTAHSHPAMKKEFASEQKYVWPKAGAKDFGSSIEPLYEDLVKAVQEDEKFYKLIALTDVFRVGRAREINFAMQSLKEIMQHE